MKKLTAAALLCSLFLSACGGRNSPPMVATPGSATDVATPPPIGANAAANTAAVGPYGFAMAYAASVASATPQPTGPLAKVSRVGDSPICLPPAPCGGTDPCLMNPTLPGCPGFIGPTPSPTATPAPITADTGPISSLSFVCQVGGTSKNSIAPAVSSAPWVTTTGTTSLHVTRGNAGSTNEVDASASSSGVSLLGGVVSATTVKSVAIAGILGPASTSSGVTGLKINGVPAATTTLSNQQFQVPGYGYVVVNESVNGAALVGSLFFAQVQTSALHLYITNAANPQHIAVNTNIVVGGAIAAIMIPPGGVFASALAAGYQHGNFSVAQVSQTCGPGTQSASATYSSGAITMTAPMSANVVISQDGSTPFVRGYRAPHVPVGGPASTVIASTATLTSLSISAPSLPPLISAANVSANVQLGVNSGGLFAANGGVEASSIALGGKTYNGTIAPNTRVVLTGVGYAVLNQQAFTAPNAASNVADLIAIHLYVQRSNPYGLATGDYVFGRAHAQYGILNLGS